MVKENFVVATDGRRIPAVGLMKVDVAAAALESFDGVLGEVSGDYVSVVYLIDAFHGLSNVFSRELMQVI